MTSKKKTEAAAEKPADNSWPAWFYGPGGVGEIFNAPDEVPEGWADHPNDAPPAIDL
jgi:hypothetical protein